MPRSPSQVTINHALSLSSDIINPSTKRLPYQVPPSITKVLLEVSHLGVCLSGMSANTCCSADILCCQPLSSNISANGRACRSHFPTRSSLSGWLRKMCLGSVCSQGSGAGATEPTIQVQLYILLTVCKYYITFSRISVDRKISDPDTADGTVGSSGLGNTRLDCISSARFSCRIRLKLYLLL